MIRFKSALNKIVLLTTIALTSSSHMLEATGVLSSTGPTIWTISGLERIGFDAQPGNSSRIGLFAARGEYEPFQIGIRAPQAGLTNVNVTVSDLSGSNNQIIPKNNITLYREHYVYVPYSSPSEIGSTNLPLGPGWYADALIPFVDPATQADLTGAEFDAVPFSLDADRNQPIWVDVFVPRNTQAGEYTGTFTVTSDQGTASGEIALKVWDFELPLKPSLNSEFALWERENTAAAVELLKHKLMPEAGDIDAADERMLINQWGLNSLSLPFWSGANVETGRMDPAPSVAQFLEEASKHQSDLLLYARFADEIDTFPNLFETTKEWARNLHQAGLLSAIAMTPVPELYDDGSGTGRSAVDIWIVLPEMYDAAPERIAEVLQKGDQVWFYNALVQDGYSPKWQIDYAPINYRIPQGFINQSLGLTGMLYWRVDNWTDDPWNNVMTVSEGDEYYPGEGMLVYPGEQVGIQGVVPSMRLKWIREGVEDYEYIQMLKNLGHGDWAIALSQQVGTNWSTWTRDPMVLESVRRQLGEELQKLLGSNNTLAPAPSGPALSPQNQASRSTQIPQTTSTETTEIRIKIEETQLIDVTERLPVTLERSQLSRRRYYVRAYDGGKSPWELYRDYSVRPDEFNDLYAFLRIE